MNEDIKTEWVKRLRDGRKQVNGLLETSEGQCCLGVLCEMATEAGIVTRTDYDGVVFYKTHDGRAYESAPPMEVIEWAGLRERGRLVSIDPLLVSGNGPVAVCLAEANDTGATFNKIATIIETEL